MVLDYFFFVLGLAFILWMAGVVIWAYRLICRAVLRLFGKKVEDKDELDPDQYGA